MTDNWRGRPDLPPFPEFQRPPATPSGPPRVPRASAEPPAGPVDGGTASLLLGARLLADAGLTGDLAELRAIAARLGVAPRGGRPGSALSLYALQRVLDAAGLPAHTERCASLEDLALLCEDGAAALIAIDAHALGDSGGAADGGQANYLVMVTGISRDPSTALVDGALIEEPRRRGAVSLTADRLVEAWLGTGGLTLVPDFDPLDLA